MAGTTKAITSNEILAATIANEQDINTVRFGKVSFVIQDGKVQLVEMNKSIKPKQG